MFVPQPPPKPTLGQRAKRAAAESLVDHCSGSPDFNFGATCCKRHDRDFEYGSRWRLDRFFSANLRLGWCIATSQTKVRVVGRVARVAVGAIYAAATSTVGLAWWIKAKPVASQVEGMARAHLREAGSQ